MTPYDFALLIQPEDVSKGISEDSDLWLPARRGRITASKRAYMLLNSRPETLVNMMEEMSVELTQPAKEGFSNKYTEHGHVFEDQAISEYDMMRLSFDDILRKPGLFVHPDFDIASATPDFFEGDDITGQVKCPYKKANHDKLLHWGVAPKAATSGHPQYYCQVQFESFVTGRDRIVFISYHPEAPVTEQVYIEEIDKDQAMHQKFRDKINWINHLLVNHEQREEHATEHSKRKNLDSLDDIPSLF